MLNSRSDTECIVIHLFRSFFNTGLTDMRQKGEIAIRASAEESQRIPALAKAQGVSVFQLLDPIQHQTLVNLSKCPDLRSMVCGPDSF